MPHHNADIKYTTDGSDPTIKGATYNAPFSVPESSHLVLAVAERNGVVSNQEKLNIDDYRKNSVKLDPSKKVTWKHSHRNLTKRKAYSFIERLKKFKGTAYGVTIDIQIQR
jgi:hypothetical protein